MHRDPHSPIELLVPTRPDEQTLRAAGVERAAALALIYGDDQVNMTAALLARSLNPAIRLVVRMYHRRFTHGRLMLEEVTQHYPPEAGTESRSYRGRMREYLAHLPWKVFLSREVTAVFGALAAIVVVLALATFLVDRGPLWRSVYLPLLDIFTMGDPATDGSPGRRILQLVAGFVGLAVLPLVVAAAMNATDAFRAASASWGLLWPGVSPRPCPAL